MSKKIEPQEAVTRHEATVKRSLTRLGLVQHLTVRFPRQKVPWLGRLGVWLVNKTGGNIVTIYQLDNGTIKSNSRRQKK